MLIEVIDETNSVNKIYIKTINDLLLFAAEEEAIDTRAEMSISFVDNLRIQELNQQYRNINQPTDVITFAMQDSVEDEQPILTDSSHPLMLGDVVISVDKAKEQAESYRHSLKREYGFLALHGFLHLLGYDHEEESAEQQMFKKQEDILNAFGLSRE